MEKNIEEKVVEKIIKKCNISRRKAQELLKISLFYGDTYKEALKNIKVYLDLNFKPL